MTPEQLKVSIFQSAFQGKLVPISDDPNDSIDELIKSIRADKAELEKSGKIKRAKKLPEITDGECPFDIPSSWKWVRLNDIVFNHGQKTPDNTFSYIDIGSIDNVHQKLNDKENLIEADNAPSRARKIVEYGDIIYATVRPYLHNTCIIDKQFKAEPIASTGFAVFTCHKGVLNKYLFYYLLSPAFDSYANATDNAKGVAYPAINDDKLYRAVVPLPILEEQHRIVAKIEELLPYVDRYAKAYEKLEKLNAKFPDDMKKSILQYAIQGKLVEQRPEEGTAEELYQQIQDERKKYKIKELSVEAIDDVPFDIPETWKWVHLQDIVKKTIKRGKSPKYTEKSEVQVFAQKCNVKTGGINMELALFLDEATIEKYPTEEYMCDGDIVINSTGGGTMGRVGVFHDTDRINDMAIVPDGHVTVIRACDSIDYKYLYYFIKHNQKFLETQGEGSTNQTELKPLTIASLVLPLPPLEEQHRIVSKIEEMLPYCDQLTK